MIFVKNYLLLCRDKVISLVNAQYIHFCRETYTVA
jgi:hypothetical protein